MSWRGSRRSLAVRALVVALLFAGVARAQVTDVALGIEALARRDLMGADRAFTRGTTDANPLLHAASWQWRAHVAWKFRGDTAAAARYLARALVEARDSSVVRLEMARLQAYRRRYREGVKLAVAAFGSSQDAERRGGAARAAVEIAADAVLSNARARLADSVDLTALSPVRDTLAARVQRFPGRTLDARALIDVAAMLNDTTRIRAGLQSYFALVDPALRALADSVVSEVIPEALARGRLHESLALHLRAIESDGLPDRIVDAYQYALWSHDLRKRVEGVYRAELNGTARPGDLIRLLNARGSRMWNSLAWRNHRPPEYLPAALQRELSSRLSVVQSVERSRGSTDELFLAHRLGVYSANGAPVVVLDGTVAAGLDDWLLDGAGGRAGWVGNDTIYERRTGFTETPYRSLLALTDPQTIPGELFRISRDSAGDVARASRDSVGYFPGVAAGMFRSGAQRLLDSVQATDTFTRSMYDNLVATTIRLHESRHRIDARSGRPSTQADDEFRAKIDEVTGAPLPRLALTAILTPNIGDGSPHGQANRRIMIGLNRWIRRNGASIVNYDPNVPALLQLPKLTDAQLRAAFEAMRVP